MFLVKTHIICIWDLHVYSSVNLFVSFNNLLIYRHFVVLIGILKILVMTIIDIVLILKALQLVTWGLAPKIKLSVSNFHEICFVKQKSLLNIMSTTITIVKSIIVIMIIDQLSWQWITILLSPSPTQYSQDIVYTPDLLQH